MSNTKIDFSKILEKATKAALKAKILAETKEKKQESPSQNWAFLLYPYPFMKKFIEAHPNFIEHLDIESGFTIGLSPLHSPDADNKKEHYHVLLRAPKLLRESGAKKVLVNILYDFLTSFDLRNKNGRIHDLEKIVFRRFQKKAERVRSFQNYARYLEHLDHPDKQQFLGKSLWYPSRPKQLIIPQTKEGEFMKKSVFLRTCIDKIEKGEFKCYTDILKFFLGDESRFSYEYAENLAQVERNKATLLRILEDYHTFYRLPYQRASISKAEVCAEEELCK